MPILDQNTLDFVSHSPEQTQRYGVRLGQMVQPEDVICLSGEMGAGKTTLTVGLGRGWGALETVTSPTFILVNEYHRADNAQLHHVDCYRLADSAEVETLSLQERLAAGAALVIEWPENILSWLPGERLWIALRYVEEEKRGLRLSASGVRYEQLLAEFRHAVFAGSRA